MGRRGFFNLCEVKFISSRGGGSLLGGCELWRGVRGRSLGGFFFREVFHRGVCLQGGVLPGLSTRGVERRVVRVLGC